MTDIQVIRPVQQIETLFFCQGRAGMMVAEMAIAARDTQVSVHPDRPQPFLVRTLDL